jgi:hypothetical protein
MVVLELFVVHVASLKECGQRSPDDRGTTNKHDFTEVEHLVLPRCSSSFHENLPVTDPPWSIKGEVGRYTDN